MLLYHTSKEEIRHPDIRRGRKNADFGHGFYLTPDRDFTYRWARDNAVVNIYEFDEEGLDIRTFERDTDWFDYIFNNRRATDKLDKDVITGPIANDTIFDTLGILSSGYVKPEDAIKLLMIGPCYTQYAIKTDKAAANLRFISSEKITGTDPAILKQEQDQYMRLFSEELNKIL